MDWSVAWLHHMWAKVLILLPSFPVSEELQNHIQLNKKYWELLIEQAGQGKVKFQILKFCLQWASSTLLLLYRKPDGLLIKTMQLNYSQKNAQIEKVSEAWI